MVRKEVKDVSTRWTGPLGPMETKIRDKEGRTYTGYGWDKKDSEKAAGEKFRLNKPDK